MKGLSRDISILNSSSSVLASSGFPSAFEGDWDEDDVERDRRRLVLFGRFFAKRLDVDRRVKTWDVV